MFQNGSNDLINRLGGMQSLQNRLGSFANEFRQSTNRSPEEVGMEIQKQMSPEQFQMFSAIADALVGKRH
jgi:hypothetical protein